MFLEEGGLDHRAVPWQHPGVVGDEERPAACRHVLDPGRRDPPVGVVDPAEDGQEDLRVDRVEAELVDLQVLPPGDFRLLVEELDDRHHRRDVDDLPPGRLAEGRGQLAERFQRQHRRLFPQSPDRRRELDAPPALPVYLRPGSDLERHVAIELFQLLPLAPLRGCAHDAGHLPSNQYLGGRDSCLHLSDRRRCLPGPSL